MATGPFESEERDFLLVQLHVKKKAAMKSDMSKMMGKASPQQRSDDIM